jgi:hypothetical protein
LSRYRKHPHSSIAGAEAAAALPTLGAQARPLPPQRASCVLLRLLRWLLVSTLAGTIALDGDGGQAIWAQPDDSSDPRREYAIKAAHLYQFGRYVPWPANSFANDGSPLVIGVLGEDPFGGVLQEIARTKRIEGRPIVVRRFASMAEYTPCNILFVVSSLSPEQKTAALQKARRSSLLLVGEEPGFAEHGGTASFFLEENKVRFEINVEAAKREQLKISSKLLSLAKLVGR